MSGPRGGFGRAPSWQGSCVVAVDEHGPERKDETVSGQSDQAKGRIKEAVGDLTDDKDLQREGKVDKGAGKAKGAVDKVKDKLKGD
jgi:uncharacterized protein YjbJ (UPF0337 family)